MEEPPDLLLRVLRKASNFRNSQAAFQVIVMIGIVSRFFATSLPEFGAQELIVEEIFFLNVTVQLHVHLKVLNTVVVLLGSLTTVLYAWSIANSIYWLMRLHRDGQLHLNKFKRLLCGNILVVVATCTSIIDATWFYYFVLDTWMADHSTFVKVLQPLPSLAIIVDTICKGLLICSTHMYNGPILAQTDFKRDLGAHRGSNVLLMMYAALNFLVSFQYKSGDSTIITGVFMILELVCRNYFMYQLKSHDVVQEESVFVENETETEVDITSGESESSGEQTGLEADEDSEYECTNPSMVTSSDRHSEGFKTASEESSTTCERDAPTGHLKQPKSINRVDSTQDTTGVMISTNGKDADRISSGSETNSYTSVESFVVPEFERLIRCRRQLLLSSGDVGAVESESSSDDEELSIPKLFPQRDGFPVVFSEPLFCIKLKAVELDQ